MYDLEDIENADVYFDQSIDQSHSSAVPENSSVVLVVQQSQQWLERQWLNFQYSTASTATKDVLTGGDMSYYSIDGETSRLDKAEETLRQSLDQIELSHEDERLVKLKSTSPKVRNGRSFPPFMVVASPGETTTGSGTADIFCGHSKIGLGSDRDSEHAPSEVASIRQNDWESLTNFQHELEGERHNFLDIQIRCKEDVDDGESQNSSYSFVSSISKDQSVMIFGRYDQQRKKCQSKVRVMVLHYIKMAAKLLFGQHVYHVRSMPWFGKRLNSRTYQGSFCFALSVLMIAREIFEQQHVISAVWILSSLNAYVATWFQMHLPYDFDESDLAIGMLLVHKSVLYLQNY